ncbi:MULTISPECIES: GNAT family N-acetyltransferase [unclassified Pseudomonas]|uniref:GNAT family N-acetyltransferase n=1 Tax=unclassified Pseudomonas TaxID=196821 RepID=UPI002448D00A|nr:MULTISPECIES: GNAT family N-acetyltransferase [unclassified Pseudomonas]MDH0302410.1 GNAT family N-acetyltransferase [Pseudomonas sp. GD04091]MDH1984852.1 GNAT family N-acetyltransferase [Pseudomonas sp. GD03689]
MAIILDDPTLAQVERYRDDPHLRGELNALTRQTYGFDFEAWYQAGFWQDDNQPCSLVREGQMLANASANLLDFTLDDRRLRCVQVGTVMTAPEARGRGYSRYLMEVLVQRWAGNCDLLYLFANSSVLDLYPRFGLRRVIEHEYYQPWSTQPKANTFHPVNMDDSEQRQRFIDAVEKSCPQARLSLTPNVPLTMFYCDGPYREALFHSARHEAYVVVEHDGERMVLVEVFCPRALVLHNVLAELVTDRTREVVLGFAPLCGEGFATRVVDNDDALFVWGTTPTGLEAQPLMFPLLSHT